MMAQQAGKTVPQLGKSPIRDVIAAMTLEEKAKLVVGLGFRFGPQNGPTVGKTEVKVPGAAGNTFAIPRLGIPSITVADGPAGLRISPYRNKDSSKSYFATAFPVGTLIASSWDTSIAYKVGKAMGSEVHDYGVDILLGPALNIHRNPLGGRNFEYYSEDPIVSGYITSSVVNGLQSNGIGTSIKHFAANNQETNRSTVNTIVSERALREIYLKGFEITVKKSNPWTVMSSYNFINGTYTSEDYDLLTTILRKEWGYKGLVMTDWFGGKDPVAQMKAGNDLLMPGTAQQSQRIQSAVEHDSLDGKVLDANVERVLNLILKTPGYKNYKYSDHPDLQKDAAVSRMAASEGMILLRNEGNALPIKKGANIALFGNTSYDIIAGGTGSGDVNKAYTISLAQGLKNAGFNLQSSLTGSYEKYIEEAKSKRPPQRNMFMAPKPIDEMVLSSDLINSQANNADYAIITIGRNAGEGADRRVENDFELTSFEKDLIQNVGSAFHAKNKKLIVVLNIGGVIEVASWRDKVDGILLAWQPGLEAGNAISDILSGKVNPSGKLATTFPVEYKDVPSAKNFPGKEFTDKATTGNFGMKLVPAEVIYEEGIYVGYRYYNTYNVQPAYEFGYGLSYTDFKYENLKLNSTTLKGKITISLTVKNTGRVAGKEVVQLYIKAPGKNLDKPNEELKGFAKTKLLGPGQSQLVSFVINTSDIASFDTESSSWVAEQGSYVVEVGASSRNFKLKSSFNLPKNMTTEKVHKVLVPQQNIQEFKKPSSESTSTIFELNNFRIGS
ncbi:MAG: glycosyl hydrolase [Bacteroidetes bacterium]|nr:MAG: glycosyl hydrolase [Bacteroidota bacterium]